jgi:hypothetical protein
MPPVPDDAIVAAPRTAGRDEGGRAVGRVGQIDHQQFDVVDDRDTGANRRAT